MTEIKNAAESFEAILSFARDLRLQGRHAEAEKFLRARMAENAPPPDAYIEMAIVLLEQGRGSEAEQLLRALVEASANARSSRTGELLCILASCLLQNGKEIEALKFLSVPSRIYFGDGSVVDNTMIVRDPLDYRILADGAPPLIAMVPNFRKGPEFISSSPAGVYFLVCDSQAFEKYFYGAFNAFNANSGLSWLVAAHIYDPSETAKRMAEKIVEENHHVSFSYSDSSGLAAPSLAAYLKCLPFLLLPQLMEAYLCPVFLADIDHWLLEPLPKLQDSDTDIICLKNPGNELSFFTGYSSEIMLLSATESARQFIGDVAAYIGGMILRWRLHWSLPSVAMAVSLSLRNEIKAGQFPPSTFRIGPFQEGMIFWTPKSIPAHEKRHGNMIAELYDHEPEKPEQAFVAVLATCLSPAEIFFMERLLANVPRLVWISEPISREIESKAGVAGEPDSLLDTLEKQADSVKDKLRGKFLRALISCDGHPFDCAIAALVSRRLNIPLIAHMRHHPLHGHPEILNADRLKCLAIMAETAYAIITPNDALKKIVEELSGRIADYIPNPIDDLYLAPALPRPWPADRTVVRILLVGQIDKNHISLLQGIAGWLAALNGRCRMEIRSHPDSMNLDISEFASPYISFIKSEAMRRLTFGEIDIFLFVQPFGIANNYLSRYEFPEFFAECLASRRPILMHGPSENATVSFLRQWQAAFIVNDPEVPPLLEGLSRLIEDTALREKLSVNSYMAAWDFSSHIARCSYKAIWNDLYVHPENSGGIRSFLNPREKELTLRKSGKVLAADQVRRHALDKMQSCKVSVIIPFFNRLLDLQAAVVSVLAQAHKNIEIILVNDGSTEDIAAIEALAAATPGIKLIHQSNAGPAAARNRGMDLATGDYIAFLDSDDYFLPRKIEIQLEFMARSNAAFSHTSYFRAGKNGGQVEIAHSAQFAGKVMPAIISGCPIAVPTVMIMRSLIDEGMRFPEHMQTGEDSACWIKLAKSHNFLGIDRPLTVVRVDDESAVFNVRKKASSLAQLVEMVEADPELRQYSAELAILKRNAAYFAAQISF